MLPKQKDIVYVERLADGPVLSNAIRFFNNISINEFMIQVAGKFYVAKGVLHHMSKY